MTKPKKGISQRWKRKIVRVERQLPVVELPTHQRLLATPETKWERYRRAFIRGFKNFVSLLVSHVGLTCAVVGYAILGGWMFKGIELSQEAGTRARAMDVTNETLEKIVDLYEEAEPHMVLDKATWNERVNRMLKDYEQEVFRLTRTLDWDGRFEGDEYQWSFANSLLYSVTVITTIGYGNITPKTTAGRLLTILYGLGGIPLAMLCLGNIGDVMANVFRVFYRCACVNMTYQYIRFRRRRLRQRLIKRLQKKEWAKKAKAWAKRNQALVTSVLRFTDKANKQLSETVDAKNDLINDVAVRSAISAEDISKSPVECQTYDVTRRYSESVLTGAKVKKSPSRFAAGNKAATCQSNSSFRGLNAIPEDDVIEVLSDDVITGNNSNKENISDIMSTATTVSSLCLNDFDDDERILKQRLKATRDHVPISMCLLLVTGYIILGAFLFMGWEGWDFLTGFYFCFITLTTIGLGDFVPGMGRLDSDALRVACTLYLLFGMALLAMSFHLIQEEVTHKCRRLAVRMGLLEEKINRMLDHYDNDKNPVARELAL
ncbi:TWiK family of potassium channels protein 18-like [Dreissena polymorpha]|uniref:TWiK family of potassium channels protein 18-like n=1 Tax=Dreissena polymorpha TaxID=45954 RepID=UPI002263FE8F|nr:TWiK family of potassium channels protein 18-like [Dreissena polymorpha]